MPAGTHDTGEEWKQKVLFRQDLINSRDASIDVGLYNSSDGLSESDDIGAITTEPSSGNYGRQSVSLDSSDVSLSQSTGDIDADFSVTFDVSSTTENVDAVFVVVTFQSDVVNSESIENDHLLSTAALGSSVDLSTTSSLTVDVTDTLT